MWLLGYFEHSGLVYVVGGTASAPGPGPGGGGGAGDGVMGAGPGGDVWVLQWEEGTWQVSRRVPRRHAGVPISAPPPARPPTHSPPQHTHTHMHTHMHTHVHTRHHHHFAIVVRLFTWRAGVRTKGRAPDTRCGAVVVVVVVVVVVFAAPRNGRRRLCTLPALGVRHLPKHGGGRGRVPQDVAQRARVKDWQWRDNQTDRGSFR